MMLSSRVVCGWSAAVVVVGLALGGIGGSAGAAQAAPLAAIATSQVVHATLTTPAAGRNLLVRTPGDAIGDGDPVIDIPAGVTHIDFPLSSAFLDFGFSSVYYSFGDEDTAASGRTDIDVANKRISVDVPASTFVQGASYVRFAVEGDSDPSDPSHSTSYFDFTGGLNVVAPGATSYEFSVDDQISTWFSSSHYNTTTDEHRPLAAGDRVTLATGIPDFFASTADGVIDVGVIQASGEDDCSANIPVSDNSDHSTRTFEITSEVVDCYGPLRSESLTLLDEHDDDTLWTATQSHSVSTYVSIPLTLVDPTVALRSFVVSLYEDYLGRMPAESEILGWVANLRAGSPRSSVAAGFVDSDEYRLDRIDAAYKAVLARAAEPGGRQSWLNDMHSGGITTDDIETSLYASDEYFQHHGGTNSTFVASLYQALLNRQGTPSEYAFWANLITQHGRAWVIAQFWNANETISERVSAMYQLYLGRVPDPAGLHNWVGVALQIGDSGLRSAITSSDEYFARAAGRYPQ